MSSVPYVMITRPQATQKTVPELVAYAKANPGKLNFGIPNGAPPHMLAAWFRNVTKTDIVIVPYRGASTVITDLIGGQIDLGFETTSVTFGHIHEGKVRALGVATAARLPDLPDVPTMIERRRAGLHRQFLDRHHGAGRHAARDRRQAQCRDQCGLAIADDAGAVQAARRRGKSRNAGGFRGLHRAGSAEVVEHDEALRRAARSEAFATGGTDKRDIDMIRNLFAALVALGAATALPAPAAAQTYPNRPIKMIVPFPAGGPIDVMARLLSQKLSSSFGTVIVENRPGGGSTVGLKAVAAAEPDGYTFLFGGTMTLSVIPPMFRGPEGDAIRGMVPIALVSSTPFVLIVAPRVPAKTVAELVAYAKANPGKLNFGAPAGATPLLVGELFKMKAGIDFTTIPYRGAATTMNDMLTGQIDMALEPTSVTLAHVHDGKIRPLAVTSRARSPELPALPTMIESGLPGVVAVSWTGVSGPARDAGGDRRAAQPGDQRRAQVGRHEGRAAQARQRAARGLAAGFRGLAGRGVAEMGRGRESVRDQDRLN